MGRLLAACLVAVALFWVSPAPADDPEVPEKYISVDEVNALVQQKKPVTFIDVRPKDQFDELHIRGAKNIPLTELPRRLASVSKKDFLVLY
jgi:rhodanese-related sulfurtransferase